jgi:phosphatidylglycerol:prolipoprotein diacylglycerol transferase
MLPVIAFPHINPVAVAIGPLAIRWYALAYVAALVIAWRYLLWMAKKPGAPMKPSDVDDFLVWATLAIILGGRLGYVLFYKPGFYLEHPGQALMLWQGGMSFHGGLAGMLIAILLFCRQRKISLFGFADMVAVAVPQGLFFGRIANFINGELFGRPSDVPWAMVFPGGGPFPRHPSQLYEALLEGLVLGLIMLALRHGTRVHEKPGLLTGIFLAGYALARIVAEFFREPDAHLGFIAAGVTMGQLLSLPLLALGLGFIWWATQRKPAVR